jgi:Putative zinc-finger
MTDRDKRTDAFERLLRRVRVSSPSVPLADCPDAETMAAWADGELPIARREAVEAHVSSCERCQMVAAAMARIEPTAGGSVPSSLGAGAWWRWLVPITAAAAVLTFWLISPRWNPDVVPAPTRAALEKDIGQVSPATPPTGAAAPVAAAERPATLGSVEDKKSGRNETARKTAESVVAAAPPPAPARDMALKSRDALANRPETLAANAVDEAARAEFHTPDGIVRWRLRAGTPERSADAGATWTPIPIAFEATVTAGAAPDSGTCWLVGHGGVVLLRASDGPWTRPDFPDNADLTAVRATDALHATVTTADGRQFETSDGGQTWVSRALQGNPPAAF